jgi:hypothetical protein
MDENSSSQVSPKRLDELREMFSGGLDREAAMSLLLATGRTMPQAVRVNIALAILDLGRGRSFKARIDICGRNIALARTDTSCRLAASARRSSQKAITVNPAVRNLSGAYLFPSSVGGPVYGS